MSASTRSCCPRSSRAAGRRGPRPPAHPGRGERGLPGRPRRHRGPDRDREGLINVEEICAASPRLESIIFGPADFAASIGMPVTTIDETIHEDPGDHFHYVFSKILMAGRANGLQVIDGPFLKVRDLEALRFAACDHRVYGFDGKWALTPDQALVLNEVYSPSQELFDKSWDILEAYRVATEETAHRRGDVRRRDDRRGVSEDRELLRRPGLARAGPARRSGHPGR